MKRTLARRRFLAADRPDDLGMVIEDPADSRDRKPRGTRPGRIEPRHWRSRKRAEEADQPVRELRIAALTQRAAAGQPLFPK